MQLRTVFGSKIARFFRNSVSLVLITAMLASLWVGGVSPRPALASEPALIFNQDGFGFSGTIEPNPLPPDIEMTGYSDWPQGFTNGNAAFAGGVYDGQSIWMIPFNATDVVKVDTATGAMTAYNAWPAGFTKGTSAFMGGVYDGQSIWMIPYLATDVVKIDKETGAMTAFKGWPTGFTKGTAAFAGGVYDGQSIWMIPFNATDVVKVDKATGAMTAYKGWPAGFTKGTSAFMGGVYDGQSIWMIPHHATDVVKVDKATGAMTAYKGWPEGFTKGSFAFMGGVYDGQSIWMIPGGATDVVKVDKATGAMTGYNAWPAGFTKGINAFFGGVYDGQSIWMIPANATDVVKVDTATGAMTAYNKWPAGFVKNTIAFRGGVFDGQSVWMVPHVASQVIQLSAASLATLSPGTITETQLDGQELEISLEGRVFVANIDPAAFTLHNAPQGLSIASVSRESDTLVRLTLAYDDALTLTANVSNLWVGIAAGQVVDEDTVISTQAVTIQLMPDAAAVAGAKERLALTFAGGDSAQSVTHNLTLPTQGWKGTTITWQSSQEHVIGTNGAVQRPYYGGTAPVTLTATVSRSFAGGSTDTRDFVVGVPMDDNPVISVETVTPATVHVADRNRLVVTGTGFRAFVNPAGRTVTIRRGTTSHVLGPEAIQVLNDRSLALIVEPGVLSAGSHTVELTHGGLGTFTLAGAFTASDDPRFLRPAVESVTIKALLTQPAPYVSEVVLRGKFDEDSVNPGRYALRGTDQVVTLHNGLMFKGSSLVIDTRRGSGRIPVQGDGRLYIAAENPFGVKGIYTIYEGAFQIRATDLVIEPANAASFVDYIGCHTPIRADALSFVNGGVRLSGAIDAGFQVFGQRWSAIADLEAFDIVRTKMDFEAELLADEAREIGLFPLPNFVAEIDTKAARCDFHSELQVVMGLPVEGFVLDFSIYQGKLDRLSFALLTSISLEKIKLQITMLGGGMENLINRSQAPITVFGLAGIADDLVEVSPTDNLIQLDPIRYGWSASHLDGSATLNIAGLWDILGADFQFIFDPAGFPGISKPRYDITASTLLNILGALYVEQLGMEYEQGGVLGGAYYAGIKVPDIIPKIGGTSVKRTEFDMSTEGLSAKVSILGMPVGVNYSFRDNDMLWGMMEVLNAAIAVAFDVTVGAFQVALAGAHALDGLSRGDLSGVKDLGTAVVNLGSTAVKGAGTLAKATSNAVTNLVSKVPGLRGLSSQSVKSVGSGLKSAATTTVNTVKDVGNKAVSTVTSWFCDCQHASLPFDVDQPMHALMVVHGSVSDDIRIRKPYPHWAPPDPKPETRMGPEVIFDPSDPNRNAYRDEASGAVYILIHLDEVGEWAVADWAWEMPYEELQARLDIYAVAPSVTMEYFLTEMLSPGTNLLVDFEAPGRTLLEISSENGNIGIFDAEQRQYRLHFEQGHPDWNAVYFADLGRAYVILDVPADRLTGWQIESAGKTDVLTYDLSGVTNMREYLTGLKLAPAAVRVELATDGMQILQISGGDAETTVRRGDQAYPLVFDRNSPNWNAYYAADQRTLYVMARVVQPGSWTIQPARHTDEPVAVLGYDRTGFTGMADVVAELESLPLAAQTAFDLTHPGRLLVEVRGAGVEGLEVYRPDNVRVTDLMALEVERGGEPYTYFLLDVAEGQRGGWRMVTPTMVTVEFMQVLGTGLNASVSDLVAAFQTERGQGAMAVEIDGTQRTLFRVAFDPNGDAGAHQTLRIYRPDGQEFPLAYDANQSGWNAIYDAPSRTTYVMTDVLLTGRWLISGRDLVAADVYRAGGEATMANVAVLASQGAESYMAKVDLDRKGQVLLAVSGGSAASVTLMKPDGSAYGLNAGNAIERGGRLFLLVAVDEGDTGRWTIRSTGGAIGVEILTVTGANDTPVGDVSALVAPSQGQRVRTGANLPGQTRWAVEVRNAGPDTKVYRPDGQTEYELRLVPPGVDADADDYNGIYHAGSRRLVFSLDANEGGRWIIDSDEMVEIDLTPIIRDARIARFDVAAASASTGSSATTGENLFEVTWDVQHARSGTSVNVRLITEAQHAADLFRGETLVTGLGPAGKRVIALPRGIMDGTYYLVLEAAHSQDGSLYAVSANPISVTWSDSPTRPEHLRVSADRPGGGVGNGEIALLFDDANHAQISRYRILFADEQGRVDYTGSYIELNPADGAEQSAVLSGLTTGKTYRIAVLAMQVAEDGGTSVVRVSLPSDVLQVYLPAPSPPQAELHVDPGTDFNRNVITYQTSYQYVEFEEVTDGQGNLTGTAKQTRTVHIGNRMTVINHTDATITATVSNDQTSEIQLFLNGDLVDTMTGTTASFALANLAEGNHVVEVVVTNEHGDRRTVSEGLQVDVTKPLLHVLTPDSGEIIYKAISHGVRIDGVSEPGNAITIGTQTVMTDDDGRFTHTVAVDAEGPLTLTITAVDPAGNVTEAILQVLAYEDLSLGVGAEADNADLVGLQVSPASLTPAFGAGTYTYTTAVDADTTNLTVVPITFSPLATVTVNGDPVASGKSVSLELDAGENLITVRVTAADGVTTRTYSLTVNRAASDDAVLAYLTLSKGLLEPEFDPQTLAYTASVAHAVESVTVAAVTAHPGAVATAKAGGAQLANVAPPGPIPLAVGPNVITVSVASEDGTGTQAYTVTVTRAASSNATLGGLTLSAGTLSPTFAPGVTAYTATVGNHADSITVTPMATDAGATITVNGSPVVSGSASESIPLGLGANTIQVAVTAADSATTLTYTVTVQRPPSSNAKLSGLALSQGFLTPSFLPDSSLFVVSLPNTATSLGVTPTAAHLGASITVNGTAVQTGSQTAPIALGVGLNIISIIVTAQDGITKQTYTVRATRQAIITIPDPPAPVNSPPTIGPIADQITDENADPVSVEFTVNDAESLAQLIVTTTSSNTDLVAPTSITLGGSGTGRSITLTPTANTHGTATITVTVSDGQASASRSFIVTVKPSTNAELQSLNVSGGELSPAFAPNLTSYVALVTTTGSVSVSATAVHPKATVKVADASGIGAASTILTLDGPSTSVTITVTAPDGQTRQSVTVTLEPPVQPTPEPEPGATVERLEIPVDFGDGTQVISTALIERTTSSDGSVKDRVEFTPDQADDALAQLASVQVRVARMVLPDLTSDTGEQRVELPLISMKKLAEGNSGMEIQTSTVRVMVPATSLEGVSDDFFFRLVPIKQAAKKDEVQDRVSSNPQMKEVAGDKAVEVVGTPMTIETNLDQRAVQVTLPIPPAAIPANEPARTAFLESLVVFIEHTDGERVVAKGNVVSFAGGTLGIQVTINKFSTFTLVQLNAPQEPAPVQEPHKAYMGGYPDGTFRPDRGLTRAELAAVLSRILPAKAQGVAVKLPDVPVGHWALSNIHQVVADGWMKGYPDGSFQPERLVTRAEMATVIARVKPFEGSAVSAFTDMTGHWAATAVGQAAASGILVGYPDATFRPDRTLTRAEATTILNRTLGRMDVDRWTTQVFPDVPTTHWAFQEISEATQNH